MSIQNYLDKHNLTQKQFAASVGVTAGMVNQWIKNIRPVSTLKARRIEEITNGELSRKALRPLDWEAQWPELAEKANLKLHQSMEGFGHD